MNRFTLFLFLMGSTLCSFGQSAPSSLPVLQFTKKMIAAESFESVGVMDVNRDGFLDLVSGSFWYQGPAFTQRYFITDVPRFGEYWDDFATISLDVNGDGYPDIVTGGWFEGKLYWLENPQTTGPWKKHLIDETGNIESIRSWALNDKGEVGIFPNTPGLPLVFYELKKDEAGKSLGLFTKHVVAEKQGHGLGYGDVNGDGIADLITSGGWYEGPKEKNGSWKNHAEFDLGDASVPILTVDVNEDGLMDLIVGNGHGYGLYWLEQTLSENGSRKWLKRPIDPFNSQYHTMEWEDIDGDGRPELITGKRYRAHNGQDPGAGDPIGLYYFKWNGESFTKNVISYGPLGEGKGAGIYFSIADLRNSGKKDIVVAGKDGLYVFFND